MTVLLLIVSLVFAGQPSKRPSDAERGEELYRRHCVQCHGELGAGDGPATAALVADVPDLRGKIEIKESVVRMMLKGRAAMPAYETSFDKFDARRVLRYMAGLGSGTPPPVDAMEDAPTEPDVPLEDAAH